MDPTASNSVQPHGPSALHHHDGETTDLLTPADVAEQLKVHPKTVLRAIHRGDLRAFNVGQRGTWRIRWADVEQWLEERANRPRESPEVRVPASRATMPPRMRRNAPRGRLELADL